jgi:hypothetical protein
MGRRVRIPGQRLLDRIRGEAITEIIDIGCAGALDPELRRGDLVLSSDDIPFDGSAPVSVDRRPELLSWLHNVAANRGVALRHAPILTHERLISRRDERIGLCESTGSVAVQMEQVWFLQLLQSLLAGHCLDNIRFTHLVMITDAVPRATGPLAAAFSAWDALNGYTFTGAKRGIASLRRDILSRWPAV